jgi:hypothetical protein
MVSFNPVVMAVWLGKEVISLPPVVRNYWIALPSAGERIDWPGGIGGETALDDWAPKRDNSQGVQPSVSGSYLRDDPMSSTAPQSHAVRLPTAHADV